MKRTFEETIDSLLHVLSQVPERINKPIVAEAAIQDRNNLIAIRFILESAGLLETEGKS